MANKITFKMFEETSTVNAATKAATAFIERCICSAAYDYAVGELIKPTIDILKIFTKEAQECLDVWDSLPDKIGDWRKVEYGMYSNPHAFRSQYRTNELEELLGSTDSIREKCHGRLDVRDIFEAVEDGIEAAHTLMSRGYVHVPENDLSIWAVKSILITFNIDYVPGGNGGHEFYDMYLAD